MLWDHYVLRVACQLSVEPYSGFCVSRVSRCDHSGEMRWEEDLQPGKKPSSSAYVPPAGVCPPLHVTSAGKKSQTGSDFFIFIKHTIRKSRMNNVSFDRWCWSKPMKEGTDDKSDVTVRHSQPWLRLTINTVYRRSSKTVERTAVLRCRSCPFQLVPTEEILFFSFFDLQWRVYPSLGNAPTATHLLTFIARNNSSVFFLPSGFRNVCSWLQSKAFFLL